MKNNTAKVWKVYDALVENGEALTAKQIRSRYGAGNPYQIIASLRNMGFEIGLNQTTNSKGESRNKYSYVA